MSYFNTLKVEEKWSIWLNFVLGSLISDEILITLRWRSLSGNFELFCLQGCIGNLAAEREIWVTTKHFVYGRRNPRTTFVEMGRFRTLHSCLVTSSLRSGGPTRVCAVRARRRKHSRLPKRPA